MEQAKDSSNVEWYLVERGEVILESDDILDCIEAKDNEEQRVTDTVP